ASLLPEPHPARDGRRNGRRLQHGEIPAAPGPNRAAKETVFRTNLTGANRQFKNDMSTMEHEIETVLRAAPKPAPPSGLKEQLIAQVRLTAVRPTSGSPGSTPPPIGWLRRWWPV